MVDYSKWDQLDLSDDDEEAKPHVTRFDKPQSITISGKNEVKASAPPEHETSALEQDPDDEPMEPSDGEEDNAPVAPGADRREDVLQCRALAERALRRGDAQEAVRLLEKAMRLGGAQCPGIEEVLQAARAQLGSSTTNEYPPCKNALNAASAPEEALLRNGGRVGDSYFWSQTKDSLQISVLVPDGTKAKDVRVDVSETSVCIMVNGGRLLAGEWEYKVASEEDPDWEMLTCQGRRVVRLTVKKKEVPGGMSIVVWWRRVLKGDPGIDVNEIQDRKQDAANSFAKAWQDAHVQFRESVSKREPIPVDIGVQDSC